MTATLEVTPEVLMFSAVMPMLLALSAGVMVNPTALKLGRVKVQVRHAGPPIPYVLEVRTKDRKDGEWDYIDDVKYFPRRPRTSPGGRVTTMTVPPGLKKYSQVCAIHRPDPNSVQSSFKVLYVLESCANLPDPADK